MSVLSTRTEQILERSLDAASLRQKVLSNNIANVDTPQFKRSDVSFESALQSFLSEDQPGFTGYRTNPLHIPIGASSWSQIQPQVVAEQNTTVNNNGNNVDIDSEMSQLALNQLKYNSLVQEINSHFSALRTAINGGGK